MTHSALTREHEESFSWIYPPSNRFELRIVGGDRVDIEFWSPIAAELTAAYQIDPYDCDIDDNGDQEPTHEDLLKVAYRCFRRVRFYAVIDYLQQSTSAIFRRSCLVTLNA